MSLHQNNKRARSDGYICVICGSRKTDEPKRLREGTVVWMTVQANNIETHGDVIHMAAMCPACDKKLRRRAVANANPVVRELNPQPGEVIIRTVASTQQECCVCRSRDGRNAIPALAFVGAYMEKKIFVPERNRCCEEHLCREFFTSEALEILELRSFEKCIDQNAYQERVLKLLQAQHDRAHRPVGINFDDPGMSDEQYICYTSLKKADFDTLLDYIKCDIRDSCNRSKRNALGIFLCKLRMDLSQTQLGFMFELDQQRVSDIIHTVTKSLMIRFVPQFLGYNHISREELIRKHHTVLSTVLSQRGEDNISLTCDGSYEEVQSSSNFYVQRVSFSMQKHYNLVKPMLVIAPDGYVVEVEGLFWGNNNDASILNSMLEPGTEFSNYTKPGDVLILDRGFKYSKEKILAAGMRFMMPHFLTEGKQFTDQEANENRVVTIQRWLVEADNSRLSQKYKFFRNRICNLYLDLLGDFTRIAYALINAFCDPIIVDLDGMADFANLVMQKALTQNQLQKLVVENRLNRKISCWKHLLEDQLQEFPRLTEKDIFQITFGTYQLRIAIRYVAIHMSAGRYNFQVHREMDNLIRVKIESRFSSTKVHQLWIKFVPNGNGADSITSYYCMCPTGARTLGTCAHITSVLWYLGLGRFLNNLRFPASNIATKILDVRQRRTVAEVQNAE